MSRPHDLRPCPGCRLMTSDHGQNRFRYPGTETEGGKYATADERDIRLNFWRCGACIGPATRAWRELGRPASTRRAPDGLLLSLRENEL